MTIPLYKTFYSPNLGERLQQVFDTGMTSEGPEAAAFQKELQDYLHNPFTFLVNSGTVGLEIAGRLAGVGSGDEVIASPTTCLAGTSWILKCGATPIWCDIRPETGCIDSDKIEALITPKTKAVTFVDWGGIPAELEAIQKIADKYGIKTIEDGAQAFGSSYDTLLTGSGCYADYTMISFQSIKILSTVDGGCLACKNKEDYERGILLRWFGLARGQNANAVQWTGDVLEFGWKGHMNDVNAAIGRENLKSMDEHIKAHQRNANYLNSRLRDMAPKLQIPQVPYYIYPNYWFYTIRLMNKQHRARVSAELTAAGIGNNVSHVRNDKYSLFKDFQRDLPNVDYYEDRRLNIPCGWWCSKEDMSYIVDTLYKIV